MKISRLWPCPKDLKADGRRLWKEAGTLLIKAGALDELDRSAFTTLCRTYDKMCIADNQLLTEGLTIKGRQGAPVKHPAFSIWKVAHDNYVALLKQFGLTPAARGVKVKIVEKKKTEKEKFFND